MTRTSTPTSKNYSTSQRPKRKRPIFPNRDDDIEGALDDLLGEKPKLTDTLSTMSADHLQEVAAAADAERIKRDQLDMNSMSDREFAALRARLT
jgi:hypothetical protein